MLVRVEQEANTLGSNIEKTFANFAVQQSDATTTLSKAQHIQKGAYSAQQELDQNKQALTLYC